MSIFFHYIVFLNMKVLSDRFDRPDLVAEMFLPKEEIIFVHKFKMADRTWRCFDKTSYVFHVFRHFFSN